MVYNPVINGSQLKVSSWNTRGLNKLVKLKQVLNRLKQMKSNIIFLQETHLEQKDINRVEKRWPGQVYSAFFTSHARGVMILIHKSVPFHLKNKYTDPSERYIILNGSIISTQVHLVNILIVLLVLIHLTNKQDRLSKNSWLIYM